ncbi:MAG: acetyl-CoA acetyltransferase [bacterium]|nr:acetyl-CoA acetyltransferase [Deltaproteobacteria bacterium]MCP4904528.1 acetyl-CoA acetyltransferase [bacterium]
MTSQANHPVLIGASQFSQRDVTLETAQNPLDMFVRIAREAAQASGGGTGLLESIDTIALTSTAGWNAQNPPRLIADALGARPTTEWVASIGGETSLALVNDVASRITRGETALGFIAGCNNMKSLAMAQRAEISVEWPEGGDGEPEIVGRAGAGSNAYEATAGLVMPINIYPLFENGLRHARGQTLEEHRNAMGALMHPFTKTAAANPHAWFPTERSPEELVTPTPINRMIFFPYAKYLNAVLATEQAAGALIASQEMAERLGVPREKWVYWRGGAVEVEDPWHVSERPSFDQAPALGTCHHTALANSGIALDEIDLIDFYSCFPIAVAMASEMLGLDPADPRGFSLTGGLPYAGGPGNSYSFHSLATAIGRLQNAEAENALVTGNGWYLTKHSASVLSREPHPDGRTPTAAPATDATRTKWNAPPVELDAEPNGAATVETYTIGHDRDGTPNQGIIVGRLTETNARFLANTPADPTLLESLEQRELIGTPGTVTHRDGASTFVPA